MSAVARSSSAAVWRRVDKSIEVLKVGPSIKASQVEMDDHRDGTIRVVDRGLKDLQEVVPREGEPDGEPGTGMEREEALER